MKESVTNDHHSQMSPTPFILGNSNCPFMVSLITRDKYRCWPDQHPD